MIWISLTFALTGQIPMAGTMTDASGAPLDGCHTLTLTLMGRSGSAAPVTLWSEPQTVCFAGGAFSAPIGGQDGFSLDGLGAYGALTVTAQVDGGAESSAVPVGWAPRAAFAAEAGEASEALHAGAADDASALGGVPAATYLRRDEIGTGLALNGAVLAVSPSALTPSWNNLTDRPLSLVDGDQDTTYSAGSGLTLTGTVFAANAPSWNTLLDRPAGLVDGDQDTTYAAGTGLTLTGTTFAADPNSAVLDARYVRANAANNAVLFASDAAGQTCGSGGAAVGTVRFRAGVFEGCTASGWVALSDPATAQGESRLNPGRTCKTILQNRPGVRSGLYWVDPDNDGNYSDAWQAWCEMSRDSGGWTLVLQNDGFVNTTWMPSYQQTTTNPTNVLGGQMTDSPAGFDLVVSLAEWGAIGTEARYEVGNYPGVRTKAATMTGFTLNASDGYRLAISAVTVVAGTAGDPPGIWGSHRTYRWSTTDVDQDTSSANCANTFGGFPWWYESCWSGSIWGSNQGNYQNRAYWVSSVSDYYNWGALWLR
jgi:hypothetical protein